MVTFSATAHFITRFSFTPMLQRNCTNKIEISRVFCGKWEKETEKYENVFKNACLKIFLLDLTIARYTVHM